MIKRLSPDWWLGQHPCEAPDDFDDEGGTTQFTASLKGRPLLVPHEYIRISNTCNYMDNLIKSKHNSSNNSHSQNATLSSQSSATSNNVQKIVSSTPNQSVVMTNNSAVPKLQYSLGNKNKFHKNSNNNNNNTDLDNNLDALDNALEALAMTHPQPKSSSLERNSDNLNSNSSSSSNFNRNNIVYRSARTYNYHHNQAAPTKSNTSLFGKKSKKNNTNNNPQKEDSSIFQKLNPLRRSRSTVDAQSVKNFKESDTVEFLK